MNERIVIDNEVLLERIERALPKNSKVTPEAWLKENQEDLQDLLEGEVGRLVRLINTPYSERIVKKPVLSFKMKDGKVINLWANRAGQFVHCGGHHSMHFGLDGTAGLVYEERGPGGHNATENDVDNESTWQWIDRWMRRGFYDDHLLSADLEEDPFYREGFNAYYQGAPRNGHPFAKDVDPATKWVKGWDAAEKERNAKRK